MDCLKVLCGHSPEETEGNRDGDIRQIDLDSKRLLQKPSVTELPLHQPPWS